MPVQIAVKESNLMLQMERQSSHNTANLLNHGKAQDSMKDLASNNCYRQTCKAFPLTMTMGRGPDRNHKCEIDQPCRAITHQLV